MSLRTVARPRSSRRAVCKNIALCASLSALGCSSSSESDGAGGATGKPIELAAGEVPMSLSVSGDDVHWTDVHFEGQVRSSVVNRVPKRGGAVTRVAEQTGSAQFFGIAASSDGVHFVGYDAQTSGSGAVFAVPASPGAPEIVSANQGAPIAVARDGASSYWVNLSPGEVMSLTKSLATDPQDSSSCIAVAGTTDVVWISHNGTPRISRVAVSGGSSSIVTEGSDGGAINCVAADSTHVYFTRAGTDSGGFEPSYNHDGKVFRVALGGGSPELIADGQERPHGIAVDGEYVYWLDVDDAALRRAPKAGGKVVTLVEPGGTSDATRTQSVVADADGVYWIADRKIWALIGAAKL